MGKVIVQVAVTNDRHPTCTKRFSALVDTGSTGLVLPLAWKEELGDLEAVATVDLETADQRVVAADVYGPVWVQIEGFRRIADEVIFIEMQEGPRGYQPLVGYTVLEKAGAAVDMVSHQLIARRHYDLKSAAFDKSAAFA